MEFAENLKRTRLVPVIVIKELGHAVPLAKALVEGGLNILEVTLRTPAALEAISAISAQVKGAIIGAGTVINGRQFADAAGAGGAICGQSGPDRGGGVDAGLRPQQCLVAAGGRLLCAGRLGACGKPEISRPIPAGEAVSFWLPVPRA